VPEAPATAATIRLEAAGGERGGYAGEVAIENAMPGAPTTGRVPLKRATSRFAYDGSALRLSELAADLGVAGRARGAGEIDAKGASRWNLVVEALNLRGLHAPLRETRLAGKIVARLDEGAQHLDVDLREKGIAIAGAASREGDRVLIPKLRAAAGQGELSGTATLSLAGAQPFEARAQFRRFDPAAFGDWPTALLNGDIRATGTLEPAWRADVRMALSDSRFRGVPLAGGGTFAASPQGVRDADATVTVGTNRIAAKGSYGRPGDSLALESTRATSRRSTACCDSLRGRRRSLTAAAGRRSRLTCAARSCSGRASGPSARCWRRVNSPRARSGRSISR
jgi:translocation and assembly module TamB